MSGERAISSFEEVVRELVDELTKKRYAHRLLVILAGYGEDMDRLMQSNRGLHGRFARDVVFPRITPTQCMKLLGQLIGKMDIVIRNRPRPGTDKRDKVRRLMRKLSATKNWANGRNIETLTSRVVGEVFRKEGRRGGRRRTTWRFRLMS